MDLKCSSGLWAVGKTDLSLDGRPIEIHTESGVAVGARRTLSFHSRGTVGTRQCGGRPRSTLVDAGTAFCPACGRPSAQMDQRTDGGEE
jgi:hypothetical protein